MRQESLGNATGWWTAASRPFAVFASRLRAWLGRVAAIVSSPTAYGAVRCESLSGSLQAIKRIMLTLVFSVAAVNSDSKALHAEVISGIVPVAGGSQQIYYETQGSGPPVVFIHGFTLDRRMWDAQCDSLAENYQVIRYDMIGHGLSSGATGTVRSWENLRDLLDFLNVDRAHVVGHSMGSTVAVDFALEFPERTASLVVVDGFLAGYGFDQSPGQFADRLFGYYGISQSQGLRPALEEWIADPLFAPAMALPEVRPSLEEIILEGHAALGTGAAFLWPNIQRYKHAYPTAISRLADIQAPTLIVLGERDLADFQNASNILLQGIPHASLEYVAEAGHMAPMEKPAETGQMLNTFFMTVPEPSSIIMLLSLTIAIIVGAARRYLKGAI